MLFDHTGRANVTRLWIMMPLWLNGSGDSRAIMALIQIHSVDDPRGENQEQAVALRLAFHGHIGGAR